LVSTLGGYFGGQLSLVRKVVTADRAFVPAEGQPGSQPGSPSPTLVPATRITAPPVRTITLANRGGSKNRLS